MTENDHGAAPSAAQGQACSDPTVATIRDLNDWFRRSFTGGLVVMTKGVESLGVATVRRVCIRVKSFETFSSDNDPYAAKRPSEPHSISRWRSKEPSSATPI